MKKPMIKVARSGYDARTAEPRYLTIDSTKNQFKVHMEGTGTINFDGSSLRYSVDIEHNLGYQPSYIFLIKKPDGKVRSSPFIGNAVDNPTCVSSGAVRVNNNTLRLYFYIWDPFLGAYDAFNVDYRYIIFVDPNKDVWS